MLERITHISVILLSCLVFEATALADGTPAVWQQVSTLMTQERAALQSVGSVRLAVLSGASSKGSLRANIFNTRIRRISTMAQINALPQASGDAEWRCLSEALYFEARGEILRGQFAVAEVILNRRDSKKFPSRICNVVAQGSTSGKKYACQFSYKCDGLAEIFVNGKAYRQVGKVARIMLDGKKRTLTKGATFYHTGAVRPKWSRKFHRTAKVGNHFFYRG